MCLAEKREESLEDVEPANRRRMNKVRQILAVERGRAGEDAGNDSSIDEKGLRRRQAQDAAGGA